jgi:hypothetical protein
MINTRQLKIKISCKNNAIWGKSGGARVITHVQVIDTKIYLLSIYDKSEQSDINDKELDNWLKSIEE